MKAIVVKISTKNIEVICEKKRIQVDVQKTHEYPAIGDVVEIVIINNRVTLSKIYPRKTKLVRTTIGRKERKSLEEEQVLASNFDYVLIFWPLTQKPKRKALERYLILAGNSGATPAIIYTKTDLVKKEKLNLPDFDVLTFFISSLTQEGMDTFQSKIPQNTTLLLLGKSGVGKSSFVNALTKDQKMKVGEVRFDDDRGRHTTTHREMIFTKDYRIIDIPGIRSIGLTDETEGLKETFEDIEILALNCKFRDCSHIKEPGCQVIRAIQSGELDPLRLESYRNYLQEIELMKKRKRGY